jgi:hypothetical protein
MAKVVPGLRIGVNGWALPAPISTHAQGVTVLIGDRLGVQNAM